MSSGARSPRDWRADWRADGYVPVGPETAARWRAAGWWRDQPLWPAFAHVAAQRPEHPALIVDRAGGEHLETLTYGELHRHAERCAAALVALDVAPGEIVTAQLPNWWQFAVIGLACCRIGAVINPLVTIFRERELRFVLDRCRTRVAFVPDHFRGFDHAELVAGLQAGLPTLRHVFVVGERAGSAAAGLPAGLRSFEREILGVPWEERVDPAALERRAPGGDDVAEVAFTSGTTGEPKGVLHTHNTLDACARGHELLGLDRDARVLMVSPIGHQTGFLHGYIFPLARGMTTVWQDVWVPGRALALIAELGLTWTMGASPFLLDAIAEQRRAPRDLSPLRFFSVAGAPIPPHLVRAAREDLGAELIAIWGMSENGVPTSTRPGDDVETVSSSDGRPVPWMEVRVVDERGEEAAAGESGRLLVRGAAQTVGYFRRPDLFAAAVGPGGWFDTGDLARRRGDGGIRIAGRTKDIIVRGGENVPVLEVEGLLHQHPRVRDVALVGVPDERLGERGCAVIVADGTPPTLAELGVHLAAAGMAKQFWPERLELVGELPKTPSGKVQKHRLRAQLSRDPAP